MWSQKNTEHMQKITRAGQTEPGLVAFYDIRPEDRWIYSLNMEPAW